MAQATRSEVFRKLKMLMKNANDHMAVELPRATPLRKHFVKLKQELREALREQGSDEAAAPQKSSRNS